jgi:hypothetical protein
MNQILYQASFYKSCKYIPYSSYFSGKSFLDISRGRSDKSAKGKGMLKQQHERNLEEIETH